GTSASLIVVPPTAVTKGCDAGSATERSGATGAVAWYAHMSEPASPESAKTLCPCAAACSNSSFSTLMYPGSSCCSSCSQNCQLDVSCLSLSSLIIRAQLSIPPVVVFGAS